MSLLRLQTKPFRPRATTHPSLLISGLILGAGSFVAACHGGHPLPQQQADMPTAKVRTYRLSLEGHRAEEEVIGTVRAKLRATLEAKVAGRIERMPVKLGDTVRAGQLIAQLDVREVRARLAQAQATLNQADQDLGRFSALIKQQAITKQEFDTAQTRAAVARAAVDEAGSMLAYATVKAPFAGIITHKLADVGDLASPGRPIAELEDPKSLRLEVGVPEAAIGFIAGRAKLSVRIGSLMKPVEGVVAEVAPTADSSSRTFLVKIDLPMRPDIHVGQFGRALVPTRRTQILRVPEAAVVVRGQLELVFVISDTRAHLRLVKTGKHFTDGVEIVAGLEPGETIAIEGATGLVDGQKVEIL